MALEPLVSILIPAFNAQAFIADTIRSALAQSWPRKEIVVVDDGSTDGTLSLARKFASPSVQVIHQENQGAAAARNKALSICRGDYIQWLDADDLLSVSDARVYYRISPSSRLSYIGQSNAKMDAQFLGMELQIRYLRARRDDERVRAPCTRSPTPCSHRHIDRRTFGMSVATHGPSVRRRSFDQASFGILPPRAERGAFRRKQQSAEDIICLSPSIRYGHSSQQ
jgi:Glycosyl transferase family 2